MRLGEVRPEDKPHDWHQQKTYDSLMTYGTGAIKFVLISNGGAILSILTFVGNHSDKIHGLKCPTTWFVFGVITGGLLNITAYLTQFFLFNQREPKTPLWRDHRSYLFGSMALIVFGVACFAIGSLEAVSAITG